MPYSVISLYCLQEMNCIMKHKIHINAHAEMPFKAAIAPFLEGTIPNYYFPPTCTCWWREAQGEEWPGALLRALPRSWRITCRVPSLKYHYTSSDFICFPLPFFSTFFLSHILCRNLLFDSNAPCLSIPFGRASFSQKTALSTNIRLSHFLCPQRCAQSSS